MIPMHWLQWNRSTYHFAYLCCFFNINICTLTVLDVASEAPNTLLFVTFHPESVETLRHLFNATSWVRTCNLQRHLSFSDQIIVLIFFIIKAYKPGFFFFNTVSFSVNLKLPIISNTHPRHFYGRHVQNSWSCFSCCLCHQALCLYVFIQI